MPSSLSLRPPQQLPPRSVQLDAAHPLAQGLVGYWLFNEGAGGSVPSRVRTAQSAVCTGTPDWTRGGIGVNGGPYLDAPAPVAVSPLSIVMGLIPRSTGINRHLQWDSVGPVFYYTGSSLAIVFQNSFDFNPGTLPYNVNESTFMALTVVGATARIYVGTSTGLTYAETTTFSRTYTGFTPTVRVGSGGLGGAFDPANAIYLWTALYNRALPESDIRTLYASPSIMLRSQLPLNPQYWLTTAASIQLLTPTATISSGGWTAVGGTGGLYGAVNESPASDADYIQSGLNPQSDTCELQLSAGSAPSVTTGHVLHIRYWDPTPGSVVNLVVSLVQGTTVLATYTYTSIPTGAVFVQDQAVSSGVAATISNYADLRVRLTATQVS